MEELKLGQRLKLVRERAGLSQRELAKRAGVNNSSVSQIEQDTHSPSLMSLAKILSAFPISISEFFSLPVHASPYRVYGPDEMPAIMRGRAQLRLMAPERDEKRLQMFIERYEPGGSTGEEPVRHVGETAVYVISGRIILEIEGEEIPVAAGSGFQIFSETPYRVSNCGDVDAHLVCAVTPSMFQSDLTG